MSNCKNYSLEVENTIVDVKSNHNQNQQLLRIQQLANECHNKMTKFIEEMKLLQTKLSELNDCINLINTNVVNYQNETTSKETQTVYDKKEEVKPTRNVTPTLSNKTNIGNESIPKAIQVSPACLQKQPVIQNPVNLPPINIQINLPSINGIKPVTIPPQSIPVTIPQQSIPVSIPNKCTVEETKNNNSSWPQPTKPKSEKNNEPKKEKSSSTSVWLSGDEVKVSEEIKDIPLFSSICAYDSHRLMDYCFRMVKCHKKFSRATKLYPKNAKDTIQAVKFHDIIENKENILVIVLTQYHLYGLFTEDAVPEETGITWSPNVSFIFEFARDRNMLNPPVRYTNPTKKTYTFGNDASAALIFFSNAFKVDRNLCTFLQRSKTLQDHFGKSGFYCGTNL